MSLRLLSTAAAAACDYYAGAVADWATACTYIANALDFEDALAAVYMMFVLVAAMGLFLPDDYPMRVRVSALVIVLLAGVSAAVVCGIVVGCFLGVWHWLEMVVVVAPPLVLAVLLLRVACRQLKSEVDELERQCYTLDDEHEQKNTSACPVCGFKDEPKANHQLWTPFYDAQRGAFRPGLLYNSTLGKYECGLVISGTLCTAGAFVKAR